MFDLILLLIFPLIWPFISKIIWPRDITWGEIGAQTAIVALLVSGTYMVGRYSQTRDYELLDGAITAKHKVDGTYLQPYSCNCYNVCTGFGRHRSCTQECSTCYARHYTVHWYLSSTIGSINVKSLDWTSSAVYGVPSPTLYTQAYIGQPCSREHEFTNYIKAVPDSLFGALAQAKGNNSYPIPKYPHVYDLYHVIRVLNVGSSVNSLTLTQLNKQLNKADETLGPKKQANIIVILTNITSSMYHYAVQTAWLGGKKNDVVVFIGTRDGGKTISWVSVMTWALNKGNGVFSATLHDDIMKLGTVDPAKLTSVISKDVMALYTRPKMASFAYLKHEIEPPTWVFILALLLGIFGSCGCTFFWWKVVHGNEGFHNFRGFN